ncbi:hypothetical protein GPL21_05940 [Bradyrhizobium pachyrhizi]|uniref:DUF4426 domain-containing protein n=1 Tax=Bradyrhizobium pachyrhizi TaxID=280333 RepID=A0A844SBK4_9BRAD|nr:hypothetical protein [Bradyrhizobium pachyrhizi]MVT64653.1 hypothetical protein [Bradyrhizobium pachyrhizi]
MHHVRAGSPLIRSSALALIAALATFPALLGGERARADESPAYAVEVAELSAKVGEPAVLHATLRIRDGYRVLQGYNNRVIELSSFDDGVTFERRVVRGTVQEGGLDFAIGVRATKPGRHPINGYFRVGYIHGPDELAMVSLRLIANVNGTE